jgi:predicted GNAT superfamily acetyltransferase
MMVYELYGIPMKTTIRPATATDLEHLVPINHTLQYPERQGSFLVQKRQKEDFEKLFSISRHFLVPEIDGKVVGYLTVLNEDADYMENEIFAYFANNYDNFVYVDQIAVDPSIQHQGVGRALYEALKEIETKRILLDVFIKPDNAGSIAFHESCGCVGLGSNITLKNGNRARVYELK